MEIPSSYLNKIRPRAPKNQPRTEREEMLEKFLDRLNPARIADGFPPFTYSRISQVLQHIPTDDLYAFLRQCDGAKSFGRFFWWSLKPRPA